MIRKIKHLGIILIITFILLELSLAVYAHATEMKIELPTYTLENTQSFWYDLNPVYGTAHLSNHHYRQKKVCFDVNYQSNSAGFRDRERSKASNEQRVLVIGDSFVEGVGVNREDRLSDLLEVESGVEHLNFGMAGNFGPTQYSLLYQSEAFDYKHDAVLLAILPSNDFIDDDYDINQQFGSDRYKPYWVGDYPNYDLVYFQDSLHKSRVHLQQSKPIKRLLKNFSYSYNVLLYLRAAWQQSFHQVGEEVNAPEIPTYFAYTQDQLERLIYALEQIKTKAAHREVMVFSIPTYEEIVAYRSEGINPLGLALTDFCAANNVHYLDLLEASKELSLEECSALFLSCDGHWSEKGNAWAKEQIQSSFKWYHAN